MWNMCTRKLVLLKRKQICKGNSCGIFCVASWENLNWSILPWIRSWCSNNKEGRERFFFSFITSLCHISCFHLLRRQWRNPHFTMPMPMTKEAGSSIQLLRQWTKQTKIWVEFPTWTQVSFVTFRKSFSCLGCWAGLSKHPSLLCPPLSVLPVKLRSLSRRVSRSTVLRGSSQISVEDSPESSIPSCDVKLMCLGHNG